MTNISGALPKDRIHAYQCNITHGGVKKNIKKETERQNV